MRGYRHQTPEGHKQGVEQDGKAEVSVSVSLCTERVQDLGLGWPGWIPRLAYHTPPQHPPPLHIHPPTGLGICKALL